MTLGRSVEVEEEKRRHPVLRFFLGLVALVILALVAGRTRRSVVAQACHASIPCRSSTGRYACRAFRSAVTVRRDQHGVPHIEAATLDDLFEAQGYVTAQDRLWQMDMARRVGCW